MRMLANVIALALIGADEPRPPLAGPGLTIAFTPSQKNGVVVDGPGTSKVPTAVGPIASAPSEVWHLTLPDAIRIGLDNSEVVRVISPGAGKPARPEGFGPAPLNNVAGIEPSAAPGVMIVRLEADASPWNFRSSVMAQVRSIEQSYWALGHQQVTLWSRETACRIGGEILARQRADLLAGRGTQADVAEAEQQLENFKLNLITATSDLMTTEKQLRGVLGLPPTDDRRIVPDTAPVEAKLEPDWDQSVASMLESSPELAQQRYLIGLAEVKAILEGENTALPAEQREASRHQLERQQADLRKILRQSSHSLARTFHQVGANHDQYRTARRLREAAESRLEAQRAFQEEGRITIDRLLDAVSQYANAIAQESQYKSTYNTAIAAFEEAKGTLLDFDRIIVLDGPTPRKPRAMPKADAVAPASFEAPATPTPTSKAGAAAPTSYKIKATFGGRKLLEVEVEVHPTPR